MRLRAASLPNTTKYEVGPSDTISRIALQYNTTPTELSRLNHLSTSLLYPGQTLFVPDTTSEDASSTSTVQADQGNKLTDIAEHDSSSDENMTFSPDRSLDRLLNKEGLHTTGDEISRKYLKLTAKYVTDGHGVVSGILLVTPQTIMFNPCVSDHLVMERGWEMYVVRLPLRAVSRIVLFEDIAAMVVGEMSKQYLPKVCFLDYTSEISPKPGMVVRQETGERYAIHKDKEKDEQSEKNVEKAVQELTMNRLQEGTIFSDETKVCNENIGSSSEQLSSESTMNNITMTSQTSEPPSSNDIECSSCQNVSDDFMDDSQLSSTPKHKKLSDIGDIPLEIEDDQSNLDTICNTSSLSNRYLDDKASNLETDLTTSNLNRVDTNDPVLEQDSGKNENISNVSQIIIDEDETHKDSILTDEKLNMTDDANISTNISVENMDVIAETMVENHFNMTPEITPEMGRHVIPGNSNLQDNDDNSNSTVDTKLNSVEYSESRCDDTKDSGNVGASHDSQDGVSVVSASHQEDNEPKVFIQHHHRSTLNQGSSLNKSSPLNQGSSLSDEARQWLGKRGVKLSLDKGGVAHYVPESSTFDLHSQDMVTPRPASKVDDPLMYVAIKIHKTYWCPIRAKQNQIMGVPPNRDEKRREHWFAIPKERVDQFYNFLLYWAPDVYGEDSSGVSTPCSTTDCENFDEKATRVDVTRVDVTRVDVAHVDLSEVSRSVSLHSVSSKSSTRSLWEDEIPDLLEESQILTKKQIHLLTRKLPSRTVGHSWELIYSTTIHGISLSTFFRNFQGNDTPVLLVVKDENDKVFGAFISEPPKVSEGFFGTGESMLYSFTTDTSLKCYNWTGDNNFFIKGSKTSLIVGGGEGLFGLWLDEDLYHGRSHSCKTFGNETLSSCEDFICCGLEAWGFV